MAQALSEAEVVARKSVRDLLRCAKVTVLLLLILPRKAPGSRTCGRAQAPPRPAPCPGVARRLPSTVVEMAHDPAGTRAGSWVAEEPRLGSLTAGLRVGPRVGKVPSSEIAPFPQTSSPP